MTPFMIPSIRLLAMSALHLAFCLVATAAEPAPVAAMPTTHTERTIEGWKVRIDDRLLAADDGDAHTRILKSLESRLSDINAVVGEPQLTKLKEVTIVVDQSHGSLVPMQYHPDAGWLKENGYDPELVHCVHIPVAAALIQLRQINVQPWCLLHELAHAYHDQVLGFDEARVLAAYRKFKASGHGDNCLQITGQRVPHYGLTDQKEFFSEMTEAYFGTNDFFPFNRGELMEAEPEIHQLMESIWAPKPTK